MRTEYNKYSIAETVQNFMVILTTTAYFETPLFCRCKRVRNEGNLLLYSHRDMKYKHAPGTQFTTGFLESVLMKLWGILHTLSLLIYLRKGIYHEAGSVYYS